jgi:amino acid adenylation domain-containing protein
MTSAAWPLTAAQRGIWLGQALAPDNPIYWTAEVIELSGDIDVPALVAAIDETLRATECLHVRYAVSNGEPMCSLVQVAPESLERIDLRHTGSPDDAFEAWARDDLQTKPALDRTPLYRTALLQLGATRWVWYLRAHHIALDGYAYCLVQRSVAARYRERQGRLGERFAGLRGSLRDASAEDQAYRCSAAFNADRDHWLSSLLGCSSDAGSDTASSGSALSDRVVRAHGVIDAPAIANLHARARALRVDAVAVLLAATALWLHERSERTRFRLGVAVAGRLGTACERLPSMAMNVLGISVRVDPSEPVDALIRRLSVQLRAGAAHQRYRYEDLRLDLQGAGDRGLLFDCVINWIPFAGLGDFGAASVTRRTLASGPVEGQAITVVPGQQRLTLEADPRRCSARELAERHAAFARVLDGVVSAAPGEALPLIVRPPSQSWLVGPPPPPAHDVLDVIRAAATRSPDHPAIEHDGRSLSYDTVWRQARSLAAALVERGVTRDTRVAVLLPRCPEMVIAQLAVLVAGGAYLPLDPDAPSERTRFVLEDAQPQLVIHDGREPPFPGFHRVALHTLRSGAGAGALDPTLPSSAEQSAYVIYTSGSTGTPRGVEVSRGALAAFTAAARERYGFTAGDRVLQFAALQFDASVEEIYVTLSAGATLVLRTDAMLSSFAALHAAVRELQLTVLDLPTAYFHALLSAGSKPSTAAGSLRLVIIGGEAAGTDAGPMCRRVFGDAVTLLNTYGPTEATVVCCACELSEGIEGAPIGLPLPGVTLAVVNESQQVVPCGTIGQLCVLGPTLATGYVARPDETARRFVALDSGRAYLTGDLVRMSAEGLLYFVGRIDDELKIAGYRVHPSEVEAALSKLPGVAEAAVIAAPRKTGDHRLVAFFSGSSIVVENAATLLRSHLPRQAIPSVFIHIPELPRDANGKLDRKRLRAHIDADDASARPFDRALSPAAQTVIGVFREVLGNPHIDEHSDFFDYGGHSLLALRAAHQVGAALQVELAVSALFEHSTANALADHIATLQVAAPQTLSAQIDGDLLAPVLTLQPGSGPPLFCVHPVDGAAWCYAGLAQHVPRIPIIGLQSTGLRGAAPATFEAAVADLAARVVAWQPSGPYRLLGWSSGGGLAHAIACALVARGQTVSLLAMLDSHPADTWRSKLEPSEIDALVSMLDERDAERVIARADTPAREELLAMLTAPGSSLASFDRAAVEHMVRCSYEGMRVYRAARHSHWAGPVLYFRAAVRTADDPDYRAWQRHVAGSIEVVDIACGHFGMCGPSALEAIGAVLRPRLS